MSDNRIVKEDQGGVNARILARHAKVDFRRVEAASVKMPMRFASAEGKRLFVRMFATLQLNVHFISVIARTRLEHEDVAKVESAIRDQIDAASASLDKAIDGAEALFKAHGITAAATYDTLALEIEVHVLSSISRRYLEALAKLDQLMPLLQTLEIHEVISAQAVDQQRAALKRKVREVANAARNLATGMRRRMNALNARGDEAQDAEVMAAEGQAAVEHAAEDAAEPVNCAEAHADASVESPVEMNPCAVESSDERSP